MFLAHRRGCVMNHLRWLIVMHSKQLKRPRPFIQLNGKDTLNCPTVHVPGFSHLPNRGATGLIFQTVACHRRAQCSVHFPRQVQRGVAGHVTCVGEGRKPSHPHGARVARVAGLDVPPGVQWDMGPLKFASRMVPLKGVAERSPCGGPHATVGPRRLNQQSVSWRRRGAVDVPHHSFGRGISRGEGVAGSEGQA